MKWVIFTLLGLLLLGGCKYLGTQDIWTITGASAKESGLALDGVVNIIFPDVGQGSAAIIRTPDTTILYDCGRSSGIVDDLNELKIKTIDLLITSHPDADHISGCRAVLEEFDVRRVVDNGQDKDTITSQHYRELTSTTAYEAIEADKADDIYPFLQYIVSYDTLGYLENYNENSLSAKFTFGNVKFLFTGDCEKTCEQELVWTADIDADVFLAGHHGSKTSNRGTPLAEITPSVIIISVGENQYGHPHSQALVRMLEHTKNIFRTDLEGSITVETDGRNIAVSNSEGLLLWKKI